MRMPIFSYFVVVGVALLGLLIWLGDAMEPRALPFTSSQMVGLPKPYKAPPEYTSNRQPELALSDSEFPAPQSKRQVQAGHKKKTTKIAEDTIGRERYAEYPHNNETIH